MSQRLFENISTVYFVGAGGIGMSSLARYFRFMGMTVAGYDRTPTLLTDELIAEGIRIHFDENEDLVRNFCKPSETLVIYTPAVPQDNAELVYFRKNDFPVYKRAEILGMLSKYKKTIAVSGTHGKTTISTMIANILKNSQIDCTAFLGGISKNFNTNFLYSGKSDYLVAEADEYDRSFLHLSPEIAVVTATDADHLDIYGELKELRRSFSEFTTKITEGGKLIYRKGIELDPVLKPGVIAFTYSARENADFSAFGLEMKNGISHFCLRLPGGNYIDNLILRLPGSINVENAVAATAASWLAGAGTDAIRKGLAGFEGVKRRFDYCINTDDLVYIDDYAHHPEELKAVITSVREVYPGRKLTGIFQPHLYSRTRDLASSFAESLDLLDELYLLNIYPARELPIAGVSPALIFNQMKLKNKQMCKIEDIPGLLKKNKPEALLTLGAGDIDRLAPIITDLFCKC